MSRRSIVILAVLVMLGTWGIRHAIDRGGAASTPVTSTTDPGFCPRDGLNPPQRLPGLRDITSISFVDSRLIAIDRKGNVWTYFRGESTCADPAPVKVLAADTAMKLHPQAGLPREAHRASILMNGQAIISLGLEFPDRCGTAGVTCTPSKMAGLDKIVASASGDRHMLVARADGSLWSSGMNDCGQLGREGGNAYVEYFKQVPGISGIVSVAAGMRSSMALDAKGTVFTWGNLSNPLFSSPTSSPAAGALYCPYETREWAGHRLSGERDDYPREVAGLPRIRQIASYYASDLALDTDGQVWGWGFNSCGQLGVNPGKGPDQIEYYLDRPHRIEGLPLIQAIASGKRHSLALDNEGRVWAWGENSDTELGERIDLSKDGSPACSNEYGRGTLAGFTAVPRLVPGIGKTVAIAAGYNSSAAIDAHGDVWVWGRH
jgi:alpha-tubulin suppressor-like RCC1 family protein